jgi:hypothetical protein
MYVIVEIIYGSDGPAGPFAVIGPFDTIEQAYSERLNLEVDHQDDPVKFIVMPLVEIF